MAVVACISLLAARQLQDAAAAGQTAPIEEALRSEPTRPGLWTLLGEAHANAGRHEAAEHAYRRSLALAPQRSETWWLLGVTQACRGDVRGVDEVEAALQKLDPGAAAEYRGLADEGCCAFGRGCASTPPRAVSSR